jgi:hypothetical protein
MANDNFKQSKFMTDAIVSSTDTTSTGVGYSDVVSNITFSGQLGSGIRFTKLDGATPAVFNPTVCIVLNTPSMWERYPKAQEMLRAIIETHATSITGIDFGYTLETAETIVGHDGQTLKVPTRTTRSGVDPAIEVPEYPGMPVYNLFKQWMFDIQHPDTNASILPSKVMGVEYTPDQTGTEVNYNDIPGWFVSAYSMSMIVIQYDPSGLPDRIYDAAIITNMYPVSIGDVGFQRQLGTTEMKTRSITFTGLVQHNEMTKALGVNVAKMLAMHKVDYDFALPGLAGETNVKLGNITSGAFMADTQVGPASSGMYYELNNSDNGSINKFNDTEIRNKYRDAVSMTGSTLGSSQELKEAGSKKA